MTYATVATKVFYKYYNREINEDLLDEIKNEINGKGNVFDHLYNLGYIGMGDYILKIDDVKTFGGNFTKVQVLIPTEDDVEVVYEKERG
jgi:hypothetical protein